MGRRSAHHRLPMMSGKEILPVSSRPPARNQQIWRSDRAWRSLQAILATK